MFSSSVAEPEAFSVNGQPVVVKNTFLDVADADEPKHVHRRSHSTPSVAVTLGLSDERGELHLHEVRRRVFTDSHTKEGEFSSKVTVCECSPSMAEVKADCFDAAEVMSTSSTQVPCSSIGSWADLSEAPGGDTDSRTPLSLDSFLNGGLASPQSQPPAEEASNRTTLMFRNLPRCFTRRKLEELLKAEGFGMLYDFIYLPAELGNGSCFGYAFINMVTPKDASRFVEYFQGFDRWPETSMSEAGTSRAVVHLSEALQGLEEMVERYRNSPLMHPSVSDELRPAVYSRGVRVAFPEPTAPIKPPRVRTSTKRNMPKKAV